MPEHSNKLFGSLDGRWHLVAAECPDDQIPQHRVDLVFHDEPAGLRGAILSRVDGSEIPLHTVAFDAGELRLKMSAPPGQPAADTPFLVMAAVSDRFEGGWDKPGTEHIRLKLVRARK
jgi:hypothetical protein